MGTRKTGTGEGMAYQGVEGMHVKYLGKWSKSNL
jgi:hypothetical protein